MNDKSKKKSMLMILAVFIAIAAFASPLFIGDDNGDSNTVILSEGTLPDGFINVTNQDDIDNAAVDNLVLASIFSGDLTIPTGKTLYGVVPPETVSDDQVGALNDSKTITGIVTLKAGASLYGVNIIGNVIIADADVTVNDATVTAIQYCTINSVKVAISYTAIQAGTIDIVSNKLTNDETTNAVVYFSGVRGETATAGTFTLNVTDNIFSSNKGRAFSGNDKVGENYLGGSEITISKNTISCYNDWSGAIAIRSLNESSLLNVTENTISNDNQPELGLSGNDDGSITFAGDASSSLNGLTTDVKSFSVPLNSVAKLPEGAEFKFECGMSIAGTIVAYDGSSISSVSGITEIKAGSLIINGELAPIGEGPIIVSGNAVLEGELSGELVILPAEVKDDGTVVKSDIKFYNLDLADGLQIKYKLSADADEYADAKDVTDMTVVETNDAGEDVVVSNVYTDHGVTVEVNDLTYNSESQKSPVSVMQFIIPGNNNINALTAIEYYLPGSDVPTIYFAKNCPTGIDESGINAGIEDIKDTAGFKDLQVRNAGTYVLIYAVSTSEVNDKGSYIVDEDFRVEFKVQQKVIEELRGPIKIYDTTTDVYSGSIFYEDICENDDISFDAEHLCGDAGYHPVIINGIKGADAPNYILSKSFIGYSHECDEACVHPNVSSRSNADNCECTDNCICNYDLFGFILPKIITEDMIDIRNTYLSFDSDVIYPIITLTLLDGKTFEVDTSKMGSASYSDKAPFDGSFVYYNNYLGEYEGDDFEDGIDISYSSLNYAALITELNDDEYDELSNYIVGPFIGLALIGYDDCADTVSEYLNLFFTLDYRNSPIEDVIDKTFFMTYYLAADKEDIVYSLYQENENDEYVLVHHEEADGINEGMRAWYFSLLDQTDFSLDVGNYRIDITAGNSVIGSFEFEMVGEEAEESISSNNDWAILFNRAFDVINNPDPNAWASKVTFEVSPGYTINYHYVYLDGTENHFEQIINPMMLKMSLQYVFSNVGAGSQIFNQWTTISDNPLYVDCPAALTEKFNVNTQQQITQRFLENYAVEGVVNLYAEYADPVDPADPVVNKSLTEVSSGFDVYAEDVRAYMVMYGKKDVTDIDDNTAWIIYDQKGYTNSVMTGILYKLVDNELVEVFSETLVSEDGRRAWYFSFENQASVEDIAGQYVMHIYADGDKVFEGTLKLSLIKYAVTVSADYTFNDETDAEGVRVSVEPKKGCDVPDGKVTVIYSYIMPDPLFGTLTLTGVTDPRDIQDSSATQSVTFEIENLSAAHAVFEWTLSDGTTVYSLSNTVVPQTTAE